MQYHTHCHRALELRADTLTDMLQTIGAFKPDSRLDEFLQACEADARGRTGFEDRPYPQADYIRAAAVAATTVDTSAALLKGLQGEQIGIAIRKLRAQAINDYKQRYQHLTVESA
jgi:tRNA nucleotidyltransferase (CCA-adding enzyme)